MVLKGMILSLRKENIFMIGTFLFFLSLFSFLLLEKIEYYYIFILSLASESVLKAMYDIKNETGNEKMYVFSKKNNQKLRYLALFVSSIFLFLVVSVIYNKIIMPETSFSVFILFYTFL